MICLRCGYCCKNYMVVIVDDPEKEDSLLFQEENLIALEGNGTPCKHLRDDKPGSYWCDIHHYPWFKDTPCGQYDQIGKENAPCRIGKYKLEGKGDKNA